MPALDTAQSACISRKAKALRDFAVLAGLAGAIALWSAPPAHADVRFHGEAGGSYRVDVMSWVEIPFRTVIRQQFDYSCGSAAVATLLRFHYGIEVDEAHAFKAMYEVGDKARIEQVGFSMLDMKRYLESHGLQADGFRMTLDRMSEMRLPGIALIVREGYRHFVVVKGVQGDDVLLGDPTFGLRVMPRKDFESMWNGVVLAVRKPAGEGNPFGFNRDEEWTPWSQAPITEAARNTEAIGPIVIDQAMRYQIRPWEDGTFLGQ